MNPPSIHVTGAVATDLHVTASDFAAMPDIVDDVTDVAPGATGRAVRIANILEVARPLDDATHCTVISDGGDYRASIPLADLASGGWLAFAAGDGPLPPERGGPFRLTVTEGTTLCWNVKNVATLRLTSGPEPDDVPESPPH